mmetsp:Transcript_15692/g.54699  ORF Transcript_15692/g.54699 Transcript_15692/m.54699 type:complete len:256 (-) Transcript_15692:948-1715(-)
MSSGARLCTRTGSRSPAARRAAPEGAAGDAGGQLEGRGQVAHAADPHTIGAHVASLGDASPHDCSAIHRVNTCVEVRLRVDVQLAPHRTSCLGDGCRAAPRRAGQRRGHPPVPDAAQRLGHARGQGGTGQSEEDRHRVRGSDGCSCDLHQVRPRRATVAAELAGQRAAAQTARGPDLEAANALARENEPVVLSPRGRPTLAGAVAVPAAAATRCRRDGAVDGRGGPCGGGRLDAGFLKGCESDGGGIGIAQGPGR